MPPHHHRTASTSPAAGRFLLRGGSGIARATLCFLLAIVTLARAPTGASASHVDGALPVDSTTLPRLVSVADVLIVVDKSYPYGDDHDAFKSFCERFVEGSDHIRKDFLIATVGVESYGDNHNKDLAEKLGAPDEEKYPQYYYLKKGTKDLSKASHFSGSDKSADSIAAFVKRTAGIGLGDTGTLEEMDVIAAEFTAEIAASGGDGDGAAAAALVDKAKAAAAKYASEEEKATAGVYVKVMAKAGQKGAGYFKSETERVSRMVDDGKMSAEKKKLFEEKLRILASFVVSGEGKDGEL